jgi:hypothetical protein
MDIINPRNILDLLQLEFSCYSPTEVSTSEVSLANGITILVRESMGLSGVCVDSELTLDIDQRSCESDSDSEIAGEDEGQSSIFTLSLISSNKLSSSIVPQNQGIARLIP